LAFFGQKAADTHSFFGEDSLPLQPQGCQKIFTDFQIIQCDYFCGSLGDG
jgi:hypothetical protein